jgi:fibronectin type 3 domain-containing protein
MTKHSSPRTCVLWFVWTAVAVLTGSALQAAPTLEWDANPEASVAGYNVYLGQISGSYTETVDVGPNTFWQMTNLNPGVTYFLAVTAYDTARLESPFSEEVVYTVPVNGVNATLLPSAVTADSSRKAVRFVAQSGQTCRIVASSDLETWESIYTTQINSDGEYEFVDAEAANHAMRYYRVVVSLPNG